MATRSPARYPRPAHPAGPARDQHGRFVSTAVQVYVDPWEHTGPRQLQPVRPPRQAPVSTLTLPQRAAATLLGDFLAVALQRFMAHMDAWDDARTQAELRHHPIQPQRGPAHR